jgi:Flp pilus assembly protein TadB
MLFLESTAGIYVKVGAPKRPITKRPKLKTTHHETTHAKKTAQAQNGPRHQTTQTHNDPRRKTTHSSKFHRSSFYTLSAGYLNIDFLVKFVYTKSLEYILG